MTMNRVFITYCPAGETAAADPGEQAPMNSSRVARLGVPSIGLVLCAALLSGCLSTAREYVRCEIPKGWKAGHSDRNMVRGVLEIVRPDESVEDWTELLTIQSFNKRRYPLPSRAFMEATGKIPGSTVTLIREEPASIMFEQHLRVDGGALDEHSLWRAIDGQQDLFAITYSVRGPVKMTPSRKAQWIDRLANATIRMK